MTWLIWRQHRNELIIATLLLIALAIYYVQDGFAAYTAAQNIGLLACIQRHGDCNELAYRLPGLVGSTRKLSIIGLLLACLPPLFGTLIGAPLVAREREQHTHYLAWTQAITHQRWLVTKLLWIAGVSLLLFTLLSFATTWDATPWSYVYGPWSNFVTIGLILPSFALFSLVLGTTISTFIPRVVPAIAVTVIALFLCSMLLLTLYPYVIPPESTLYPINITSTNTAWGRQPEQLILYAGYADQQGNAIGEISRYCSFDLSINDVNYGSEANNCIKERHLQWKVIYQPPERFWPLQIATSSLLLILSLLLLPLIFWRLKRVA